MRFAPSSRSTSSSWRGPRRCGRIRRDRRASARATRAWVSTSLPRAAWRCGHMTELSSLSTTTPAPSADDRHMKDGRFLETLQATLASCGNEAAVYNAAVHRVAAAFEATAACLAAYD